MSRRRSSVVLDGSTQVLDTEAGQPVPMFHHDRGDLRVTQQPGQSWARPVHPGPDLGHHLVHPDALPSTPGPHPSGLCLPVRLLLVRFDHKHSQTPEQFSTLYGTQAHPGMRMVRSADPFGRVGRFGAEHRRGPAQPRPARLRRGKPVAGDQPQPSIAPGSSRRSSPAGSSPWPWPLTTRDRRGPRSAPGSVTGPHRHELRLAADGGGHGGQVPFVGGPERAWVARASQPAPATPFSQRRADRSATTSAQPMRR
jgi:hypothetical protein